MKILFLMRLIKKILLAWTKAMNDPYPKQDSTLNYVFATNNNNKT